MGWGGGWWRPDRYIFLYINFNLFSDVHNKHGKLYVNVYLRKRTMSGFRQNDSRVHGLYKSVNLDRYMVISWAGGSRVGVKGNLPGA